MTDSVAPRGPVVPFDRRAWVGAFTHDTNVIAELVRQSASLDVAVPGLTWTAGEVVKHLVVVYRAFAASLRGEDLAVLDAVVATTGTLPERLSRTNADAMALIENVSNPAAFADLLLEGAAEVRQAFGRIEDVEALRPAPWYGKTSRAAAHAVMAESETLVHGQDIARALGGDPKIRAESAAVVAPTVMSEMLPLLVNQTSIASRRLTLEFRVRGGPRFGMLLDHGVPTVMRAGSPDVDCIISTTAAAALLIGYGRLSVSRALLTGRAVAFGRAPWLGLRYNELFLRP